MRKESSIARNAVLSLNNMVIINSVLFLVSLGFLVLSGYMLVKYITKIAYYLRLSDFIVSFVIIAVSTSLPELFVGISSAIKGIPSLALGTVIGANLADLTIVIGIPLVMARSITTTKIAKKDAFYMFFIALVPMALMLFDSSLSRLDGAILFSIFLFYMWSQIRNKEGHTQKKDGRMSRSAVVTNVLIFVASLFVLFYSAEFVVRYASALSADILLPTILMGLLVSFGTSLPELSFNTMAVMKGHKDMAIGDSLGSVVANSTLVLGVTALIHPIDADLILFLVSYSFMIIVAFLFAVMVDKGKRLNWREGMLLIMMYIFIIMVEFYIRNIQLGVA